MKVVEHNAARHRGLPDDDSDLVVSKGCGSIRLSEGQAYQLCYELILYLHEESES